MDHRILLTAIASLRAEIIVDSYYDTKKAIRVKLPAPFQATGYNGDRPEVVLVGGYRSEKAALLGVSQVIAEIAAKMATAALTPELDPPVCKTSVAWVKIAVAA